MFRVTVAIECDRCGAFYKEENFEDPGNADIEAVAMEEDAQGDGWVVMDDYEHLCPECLGKGGKDADATQANDGDGPSNEQEDANASNDD